MTLGLGLALLPLALARGSLTLQWSILGWLVTTVTGIAGGFWVVSKHGTPGVGFLVALGVCMLARLALAMVGAVASVTRGTDAVWAYLAGLLIGYVVTQTSEVVWLARKTSRPVAEG